MQSGLEFLRGAEAKRQVGSAVAVRAPAGGGAGRWRASTCALFGSSGRARGDGADLRLRRRARRHRAVRAPAGVQRHLRRVRPAGAVERGRVRARSCGSAAARSGWPACSTTRRSSARPGSPTTRTRGASCSPAGTRPRPPSSRSWSPTGRIPPRPGHRPDHPGGAGRRLDGRRRVHLGRGVGTRGAASTRSAPAAAERIPVFAGDVVPAKKPDPAIYLLAVDRLGLDPADTLVVEDSRNGLLAATGAGLPCLVTVNGYTRDEDFDEAVLVVSELGDPDRPPIEVLANRGAARPGDYVTLDDLRRACRRRSPRPAGQVGPERGDPHDRAVAARRSSSSSARSRRPRSTTRSTSATSTPSSATATSATRWPAASRRCSRAGTTSTAPTPAPS